MSSDVRLQQRAAPVGRVLWCDPLRRGPPEPQDPSHHSSPTLVDEVANRLADLLAVTDHEVAARLEDQRGQVWIAMERPLDAVAPRNAELCHVIAPGVGQQGQHLEVLDASASRTEPTRRSLRHAPKSVRTGEPTTSFLAHPTTWKTNSRLESSDLTLATTKCRLAITANLPGNKIRRGPSRGRARCAPTPARACA